MFFAARQIAALLVLAGVSLYAAGQSQEQKPYHQGGSSPVTYSGPGREDPEPTDFSDVPIGFFGPSASADPDANAIWQGASLAIEEANRAGGYHGKPFRLVPAWAENPWSGGAAKLVQVIYSGKVWAIVGGIDGPTTHLAEQIVTKLQLTIVNPAATDRTIHSANVPWMFSCVPGDPAAATLISKAISETGAPFAMITATDHDSRALVTELKSAFGHDRISPALQSEFEKNDQIDRLTAGAVSSDAKTVIVVAGTRESYAVVRSLLQAGFKGQIFGGASITRATPDKWFTGVIAPVLGNIPADFQQKFTKRYSHPADYASAHAHDAANILTAAIRSAGLNRVKIRDAVRALSPYAGITGKIEWDTLGQNQRVVTLRAIE